MSKEVATLEIIYIFKEELVKRVKEKILKTGVDILIESNSIRSCILSVKGHFLLLKESVILAGDSSPELCNICSVCVCWEYP